MNSIALLAILIAHFYNLSSFASEASETPSAGLVAPTILTGEDLSVDALIPLFEPLGPEILFQDIPRLSWIILFIELEIPAEAKYIYFGTSNENPERILHGTTDPLIVDRSKSFCMLLVRPEAVARVLKYPRFYRSTMGKFDQKDHTLYLSFDQGTPVMGLSCASQSTLEMVSQLIGGGGISVNEIKDVYTSIEGIPQ